MTLDDHLGDIIRKARVIAGVSIEAAAGASGATVEELIELEKSGRAPASIDLSRLAGIAGLNGPKLAGVAAGWRPAPVNFDQWRELRRITTTQNGLNVHCYLIWDEVSLEAALFDTGWNAEPIAQIIDDNRLTLKHLFLTHSHEDHMGALAPLRERFPKLHLHTGSPTAPPQHRNRPNDFIHLGSLRITNRPVPGHSPDGVAYIIGNWPDDAPHVAIVGDTLFAASVATPEEPRGVLTQKIREQLFSLPPDTVVCPGHGPATTIAEEKAHNPFF